MLPQAPSTASIYATRELAEHAVPANLIVGGVMIALAVVGYYLARPQSSIEGRG
jgi:hypothetical protein